MSSLPGRVAARRLVKKVVSGTTAVMVTASLLVLGMGSEASAAGLCATPGGSGAGGTLSGVVNSYYPGVGTAAAGATSISVGARTGAATPIAAGDLLLVIQMQAATIDSTNTTAYGDGVAGAPAAGYTALGASGAYEYVRSTSAVAAGSVSIAGLGAGTGLLGSYTSAAATPSAGQRSFQVVRVPQHTTATTSSTLTAAAWNGSTGGVLALDTTGTLTLNGNVSVDGLGFRGGVGIQRGGGAGANTDVVASSAARNGGTKGEGIAGTPSQTIVANGYPGGDVDRGAPANGGGGGTDGNPGANDQNTGGGGGANGGAGGVGGNAWSSGVAAGGFGGAALTASAGRVFLGGGGGAGTGNNFTAPNSGGAAGGGIVLIRAASVAGAGSITANGVAAFTTTPNDGGGGGGAGGTIVLTSPSSSLAGATLAANGGRGGDAWRTQAGAGSAHGPGGGGGGGWILTSSAPTSQSVAAGVNGITTTGNLVFGSAPGSTGRTATVAPAAVPGVSGGAECADLSITKSGPASVVAGTSVTYVLDVANAGPAAATAVSVTDALPAGVTFVSADGGPTWACSNSGDVSVTCTRASLAAATSAPPITVVVTAPDQAGPIVNAANVTSASADPVPGNNDASATTTVTASADVSIVKTGPIQVDAGGTVVYQLVVSNAGPSDAAAVSVVDTLPPGVALGTVTASGWTCGNSGDVTVTCTRPSLAAGASSTITVEVSAPGQADTLLNDAEVSSTTPDPVPDNNTSSVSTDVTGLADLSIVKAGPAEVVAGSAISYDLDVSNSGPSDAVAVSVTDTLPAGTTFVSVDGGPSWSCSSSGDVSVTCTLPSLASGDAAPTITIVVTAPTEAASLTNSAQVSSATKDPVPGNDDSSVDTAVTASADLSFVKAGPAEVVAGSAISYDLDVSNAGPSDAVAVSVTDTLPAGTTFVSVDGGPSWSCSSSGDVSVTCTLPSLASGDAAPTITIVVTAPTEAASLTNSAEVSSTTPDPVSGNDSSSVDTTVTASADLSIVKTGPAQVAAGGLVSYDLDVSNAGPSDAVAVSVTDMLPAGTTFVSVDGGPAWSCSNAFDVSVSCTSSTLASGASSTITVVVTAPARSAALTNTAEVTSSTPDPDPDNNGSSASTQVAASADLSIVKTAPASVETGAVVRYTLVVSNAGPDDALDVEVTDSLPAGVTFVTATGDGWTCQYSAAQGVRCTLPSLATGTTAPALTILVSAPTVTGSLVNEASVASATADPVPDNNAGTATVQVTKVDEPSGGGGGGGGGNGGSGGTGGSGGGGLTDTGVPALVELAAALAFLVVGVILILGARRRT